MRRKAQRCLSSHSALRQRNRSAVFGNEHAGDTVKGPHALDVLINNVNTGRAALADRIMQFRDRRFFDTK